jgi:hypothetical protein
MRPQGALSFGRCPDTLSSISARESSVFATSSMVQEEGAVDLRQHSEDVGELRVARRSRHHGDLSEMAGFAPRLELVGKHADILARQSGRARRGDEDFLKRKGARLIEGPEIGQHVGQRDRALCRTDHHSFERRNLPR